MFRNFAWKKLWSYPIVTLGVNTFVAYSALDVIGRKVGFATLCSGQSMLPTINEKGDVIIVQCTSKYEIGDVVVSCCPNDPEKAVCKRIRAMEGDVVTVRDYEGNYHHTRIPKGHVWLQGDNFHNSRDSRTYGPVSIGLLHGKTVAKMSFDFPKVGFSLLDNRIPDGVGGYEVKESNEVEECHAGHGETDDGEAPREGSK